MGDEPVLELRYRDTSPLRTAAGREFYYEENGTSGPHLTIVNNFFLTAPMWRTFTGGLAERNRILTYDLRNQGASTSDPGETAWQDHVDDLTSLLDGLGVESTYLVGTSISALICRDFALAHPERVTGLVLVGPVCTPSGGRRRRAITRSWANTMENGGTEALWDHLYSMVLGEPAMKTLGTAGYLGLREAFTSLHSVDIVAPNLRSSLEASDDPALLAELACPTLLMVGEEDFLWCPSTVAETERLIRDVTTVWLPAIGHLPYMEDTDAFQEAVQAFIDEVETAEAESRDPEPGDLGQGDPLPRLRRLLGEVLGERAVLDEGCEDLTLSELGLESWGYVALLASIEREFGVEWDVDVPMSSLRTLSSIGAHLGQRCGVRA
ncbi:alpha/beta fold hydrolase [Actinocorallia longicatena]|uniref:Pimeloyl-ACP methyl ester carboxylesterase n=1 Tax=Actinocorallia longicatena TaxID=111803 RepID=A0ABP6Q415_9ACTN